MSKTMGSCLSYSPIILLIGFDSIAHMNKFMYVVLDLVKTVCRNSMLLENMRTYRLMTHAQQVDVDNLREHAKENKKARSRNYEYSHKNWVVEITHKISIIFHPYPLHHLVFNPPRTPMIKKVGHQVLSLRDMCLGTKTYPHLTYVW